MRVARWACRALVAFIRIGVAYPDSTPPAVIGIAAHTFAQPFCLSAKQPIGLQSRSSVGSPVIWDCYRRMLPCVYCETLTVIQYCGQPITRSRYEAISLSVLVGSTHTCLLDSVPEVPRPGKKYFKNRHYHISYREQCCFRPGAQKWVHRCSGRDQRQRRSAGETSGAR